jgi:hypothetical protein
MTSVIAGSYCHTSIGPANATTRVVALRMGREWAGLTEARTKSSLYEWAANGPG